MRDSVRVKPQNIVGSWRVSTRNKKKGAAEWNAPSREMRQDLGFGGWPVSFCETDPLPDSTSSEPLVNRGRSGGRPASPFLPSLRTALAEIGSGPTRRG